MNPMQLITALGTPLEGEDDALCVDGLACQLDDQSRAGVPGILAAGTMGVQQMLSDATWRDLVRQTAELSRGRFEVLVGITDQSLQRVRDRLAYVETLRGVDGVVVLTPSAMPLTEAERMDFYRAIADASRLPTFLYELAPSTGVTLSLDALVELSAHPNIAGVKLSASLAKARTLREQTPEAFRVIPADPQMLDVCALSGIWREHLDGVFAATPDWAVRVTTLAAAGDAEAASRVQQQINGVLRQWVATGQVYAAFTATMNARGIPGRFHPKPMRSLTHPVARSMLGGGDVAGLLAETAVDASVAAS